MKNKSEMNFKQLLKNVKAMVFDVDGVLSRSIVHIQNDGELIRTANVKDGFILKTAISKGIKVGIITGGYNEAVKKRYNGLGITDFYLGVRDKVPALNDFLEKNNLIFEDILYMGDDLPDYEVMKLVGIPVCPADASTEIKSISVYVSNQNGGEACVRDIVEQVLRAQGKWF